MKALVTGAAGFVGANLVRHLLASGDQVRCLVRYSAATLANLDEVKSDIEVVFGDIRDERSLRRAVDGCDRVYHCAALFALQGPVADFVQHNVLGTRMICRVCLEHKIERMVYTSSVVAVGTATGAEPADEETVWNLGPFNVPYQVTKHLAEVEVLRAIGQGLDAVIVNPSSPLGPFDRKPTPTGKLVLDLMRGKMRVTADVGIPFVDVRDVAVGHRLAMERGIRGERYILSAQTLSLNQLALDIHHETGVVLPWLRLNKQTLSALLACRWVLPGVAFPFLNQGGALTTGRMDYSNRKSVEKLGLTYHPVAHALRDQMEFYYRVGMATRQTAVASPLTQPAAPQPVEAVQKAEPTPR